MKAISFLKTRIKSSGGYFFDQAMVSGGNFILTVLLGRSLGPEGFGWYSLGWMVVLGISSLQQAFILTPLLSLFGREKRVTRENYLGALATLQLIFSSAIVLLIIPVFLWGHESIQDLVIPTAVASLGHQLYDFIRRGYLVRQTLPGVQRFDAFVLGLQIATFTLLILFAQLDPVNALYAIGICYIIPSIHPFLLALKYSQHFHIKYILQNHWEYGRWLGATALLQWFGGNFFILAGGALLGTTAMGAIRMAQTVIGVLNPFLLALDNFVPVRATKIYRDSGSPEMGKYLILISKKSSLIFFPILIGIVLFAPFFINLVFGPEYIPYAFVLRAFVLLYGFVFIGTILRYYFRTTGDTREIFFAYVICAAASLLLAYPFVEAWGLSGILAGLILCQCLTCGWLIFRIPFQFPTTT